MTTLPVSLQERIPIAVGAPAGPPPSGAALSPADIVRILRQRVFLIMFIWFAITGITVAYTWYAFRHWTDYKAAAQILVESPNLKAPLRMDAPQPAVDVWDRFLVTEIQCVTADNVLSEALKSRSVMETEWYKQAKGDSNVLLDDLKENMKVIQIPNTNLMNVSFSTRKKEDPAKIVNAVVDKYIAEAETGSKSRVQGEYNMYQQQTADMMTRLAQRRKDKAAFATQFGTPGVAEGLNVVGDTFRSLSEAVTKLEADKLQFKAEYDSLKGINPEQIAVSPQMTAMIQQDPQVYALTNQIMNLQQERDARLRRVGPHHREVQQIDAMVASAQASLKEVQTAKEREVLEYRLKAAEQAYLNATSAEAMLRERLTVQEGLQQDIDSKMAEYRSIEEDVRMLEEQYNTLNQFTAQLGLMQAGEATSRVTRGALAQDPRRPSWPRWEITLPAGSFLGLVLGVGLALLLELIDTSIKTSRDIARHVHTPILGTVPDVDDEEVHIEQVELASKTSPRSMVAESFRSIRTNLLLSAPAERQRTVLVASARPEEGRTTVAMNLAFSIAQNGRRVLLVDANFHRPAVQRFFPNTSGAGLSNILIGQGHVAELAVQTDLPNLDVLPTGPIPPNPTELLAGPYLKTLIAEAQDRYDQIVFDGPPVLLVSDGLVLAGVVDGVVLVCRAKATSRGVAMRGREQIERVNGRIFGAVLNAAQITRGGYFREQIRSYYDYQPAESLAAPAMPILPPDSGGSKT